MACCAAGKDAADFDKDPPEQRRERFAYWFSGFATGPDTILGALWSIGFLFAATSDASCYAGPDGLSSGADGEACTVTSDWNQSLFESVGGDSCYGVSTLGASRYFHDPAKAGCMDAFAAYRLATHYTCNCSGSSADHAYLGGADGPRPAAMFTLTVTVGLLITALFQPAIGTAVDYMPNRKKMWWILYGLCTIATIGMAGVGTGGIWWIGFVTSILALIFSEVVMPIRASYLEDVAKDECTMGYCGAMRQVSAYGAQLLFVIVAVGFQFATGDAPMLQASFFAVVAGAWYGVVMPFCLVRFRDHPAKRANATGKSMLAITCSSLATELAGLKQYPEALKYMFMTSILQVGGPVVVAVASTFATQGIEMPSILYTLTTAMVLLCGLPAAYLLANVLKKNCITFKKAWAGTIIIFILIAGVVPAIADGPNAKSHYIFLVLAGPFGGVALSWFYSLGWACFCTMVPYGKAGQYSGIYNSINTIFSVFGPLIYTGVVQGTNNHQIAWLVTCLPPSVIALILLAFTNFEKAKKDAARDLASQEKGVA